MASVSQSASTARSQTPTAKQEAFISRWLPEAEAHYKNMLKRSSDELWSILGLRDARDAFHISRNAFLEYAEKREELIGEFESLPDGRQLELGKAWGRFLIQMKKLREATNVLLLGWEAYREGDMGLEKRTWYHTLPKAFRQAAKRFSNKVRSAAKRGSWS
ncbi:hypothetical protein AC579_9502 [Pseudocercospora musae]|uniref:Uncharacterized protein n=1 Tax=Pseudocercospora musae TaxID=113226 RepID=A0A139IME9_9PEZI|nr:hypothetical protein AC579_9502 [Pseudocercospora musae]